VRGDQTEPHKLNCFTFKYDILLDRGKLQQKSETFLSSPVSVSFTSVSNPTMKNIVAEEVSLFHHEFFK